MDFLVGLWNFALFGVALLGALWLGGLLLQLGFVAVAVAFSAVSAFLDKIFGSKEPRQ